MLKRKEDFKEIKQYLLDMNIATEAEIQLVCNINGINIMTLNDILFARTGYRNINQMEEE